MTSFHSNPPVGTLQRTAIEQARALRTERPSTPYASRFVRLLSIWDRYEIEVLKALFHYRPSGGALGPPLERMVEYADECFAEGRVEPYPEKPRSLMYANPPLEDWLQHAAQERDERRWAFESIFGIELAIGESDQIRFSYHCHRDVLYNKRDAIAQATPLDMTLREYWRADRFVCWSLGHLAKECRTKHMLLV